MEWYTHDVLGARNKSNRIGSKSCSLESVKKYAHTQEQFDKFEELKNSDWCFRKIKEINFENYDGEVYDLVVEDNHTFVAGNGNILVHNTGDNGAIIDDLFDMGVPQEHLLKVFFNSKMEVDFERDTETNVVLKDANGKIIMKEAMTIDWAMSELEKLFYGEYEVGMDIPQDENFLEEFNGFIVKMNGMRKSYGSTTSDHKHQSFQCFAICRFYNEFNLLKNKGHQKRCYGVI